MRLSIRLLNWTFNKSSKPRHIEDPVFGKLTLVEAKNPSESCWHGCGRFDPTGSEVSYEIDSGQAAPSDLHRAFYRDIEARYVGLLGLATPLLKSECAAQMAACDVFFSQLSFSLETLCIPGSESMEWSLVFSCVQWDDALFTVHVKEWQPTGKISVMD